ncbi:Proteasome subunit beta type-3-A [Balamuthia mandrillaris]
MSILEYNGGAVIAMVGKDCVAIASDTRFGVQGQTLATDMPKIHRMNDKTMIGFAGLTTDAQTLHNRFKFRMNMYKLRENREMEPEVFANLVSTMLYEKRFGPYFVEPVIAGLQGPEHKPFITAMDLIGAPLKAADFVISGTCTDALYGTCESLYKPNLEPEDLFEVISQALLSSVNRDAFSGWGAVVYIMTPTEFIVKELQGRQD